MGNKTLSATGTSTASEASAKSAAKIALMRKYEDYQKSLGISELSYESSWMKSWQNRIKYETIKAVAYAKGTTGTTRDEWAITDEPRFGDELVLVPGKDGNLSFMRKGTGVVPADLTANLMEWGQFTPGSMNLGGGVNVNMINNAVNKPEFNMSFDSLVHVDHCDEGTLKDLEKMVDTKINQFGKQMNYAIKKIGGR